MALACDECNTHKDYLDSKDPCVCFASDIMGTFANDATKTKAVNKGAATEKAGGATTENVGAARLSEGWMWHCRPLSKTEGVWQECCARDRARPPASHIFALVHPPSPHSSP